MPGISKGFSLLEILMVLMIIMVLSLGVVPFLQRKADEQDAFIAKLNALVDLGRLRAQTSHQIHRILFDLQKGTVILEAEAEKKPGGEPDFKQVPSTYLATNFDIPASLEITRLYIDGKDELAGAKTTKAWFFIGTDGTSQDVELVVGDVDQHEQKKYVLQPFQVQFKVA